MQIYQKLKSVSRSITNTRHKKDHEIFTLCEVHTGSFYKYHDDGLQQAVLSKKWLIFWSKQLNWVVFDIGSSAYYFRTNSFLYTDLQTHALFFNNVLSAKIVQILVLIFFFSYDITFDSATLKKPIASHLKDFFSINKSGPHSLPFWVLVLSLQFLPLIIP